MEFCNYCRKEIKDDFFIEVKEGKTDEKGDLYPESSKTYHSGCIGFYKTKNMIHFTKNEIKRIRDAIPERASLENEELYHYLSGLIPEKGKKIILIE